MSALLFVHAAMASDSRLYLANDTLIIDGDTIYVEREEILFAPDSLPQSTPAIKSIRPSRWSLALGTGMNVSNLTIIPFAENETPLDNFLKRSYNPLPGWMFHADGGGKFVTFKGRAGTIEVAAMAGLSIHRSRFRFSSIDNPNELLVDSTISVSEDKGELLLQYFTITEPPDIGEVDSIYPQLAKGEIQFGLRDVSMKFRATFYRKPSSMRYFVETGIIRRSVEMTRLTHDFYYIYKSKEAIPLNETKWQSSNVLVPHFAVGAEKTIHRNGIVDRRYWTLGAIVQVSSPATTVMRSDLFSVELRNSSLSIFGRFCF
jgi:hypothetical protein